MGDKDLINPSLDFVVTAKRCQQSSFGTADLKTICRCDDGNDYAIKDGLTSAQIPHSEWFCTKLGEEVGLASPSCKIVSVSGEHWFGSRWETGHDARDWWLRAIDGQIDFALLSDTISRIFAFDLFVHNEDRHLTNYIIRQQHFGVAMLAFDYSKAWICNGFPPPDPPMNNQTNTIKAIRFLRQKFGDFLSIHEASTVLDNIDSVDSDKIENIILSHPKQWLTDERKSVIIDWWKSTGRSDRIRRIKEGIGDGSYL